MAYYEEPRSRLEMLIGRRFPLAISILIGAFGSAYYGLESLSTGLVVVLGIIGAAYYQDVAKEKATIRMMADEQEEVI